MAVVGTTRDFVTSYEAFQRNYRQSEPSLCISTDSSFYSTTGGPIQSVMEVR